MYVVFINFGMFGFERNQGSMVRSAYKQKYRRRQEVVTDRRESHTDVRAVGDKSEGGKSYKDILTGPEEPKNDRKTLVIQEHEVLNLYSHVVWRKTSVWGETKNVECLDSIKDLMQEIWLEKDWEARYLGGLKVLITLGSSKDAQSVVWEKAHNGGVISRTCKSGMNAGLNTPVIENGQTLGLGEVETSEAGAAQSTQSKSDEQLLSSEFEVGGWEQPSMIGSTSQENERNRRISPDPSPGTQAGELEVTISMVKETQLVSDMEHEGFEQEKDPDFHEDGREGAGLTKPSETEVKEEVGETIRVGKGLGIDLNNFQDQFRSLIQGEREVCVSK
ncbi:hypothetical protein L1987_07818 [Smallanthus sonchifolius]|uniref:Uncharacterized protein n=1 Tax=Smallanthus sonchifolius TaxID=185202 RepID=A0ACB9JIW1_9ASTR|nr:hypothetical protein L1987_07818 [Smallanthus sonchifolius]